MPDNRSRRYGVRPRGDRWVARPYVNGDHHWLGTFAEEEEATEAAKVFIEASKRMPVSKETVRSFAARWLTDYPRQPDTAKQYGQMAKLFVKEYGNKKMREISNLDARRFKNKHRGAARMVRTMFSDAVQEGLIEVNPFIGLKLSGEGRGRRGRKDIAILTAEELALLEEVGAESHPHYDFAAVIRFAAYTGMRPSEIYGLEWTDIDTEAEEIRVNRQLYRGRCKRPKNKKARRIVLAPPAAEILPRLDRFTPVRLVDELGKTRPMNLVFRNKSHAPLSATSMHFYWSPVRTTFEAKLSPERRAELRAPRDPEHPEMDFYELRHLCATYLLEKFRANGEDGAAEVAIQLGHTDEGDLVRELYGHPSDDLARDRIKRLWKANVEPLRPVDQDEEAANG